MPPLGGLLTLRLARIEPEVAGDVEQHGGVVKVILQRRDLSQEVGGLLELGPNLVRVDGVSGAFLGPSCHPLDAFGWRLRRGVSHVGLPASVVTANGARAAPRRLVLSLISGSEDPSSRLFISTTS